MKAKLATSKNLRFDEKSFFNIFLLFNTYCDHICCKTYTSNKTVNMFTFTKVNLKCDGFEGSIVDAAERAIKFAFASDMPLGFCFLRRPKTIT